MNSKNEMTDTESDLPEPISDAETQPTPSEGVGAEASNEIEGSKRAELPGTSPQGPTLPQDIAIARQHVAGSGTATKTTSTPEPTTPVPGIADDVDLIEKEWVDKAKTIVDRTKDDPHAQNKEVNMLKADYIKKRFNKDIKVSET